MSDIDWSHWIQGDGSEAESLGAEEIEINIDEPSVGIDDATHYRIPMSDYKRITGMPEWSEAPEWAQWLAQDEDGEWTFFEEAPKLLGQSEAVWVKRQISSRCKHGGNGHVLGDFMDTLQERPAEGHISEARAFIRDQCLEIMPDGSTVGVTKEEISSVLGTGPGTIDDTDHQPPRSKYHREIAPGVWVDVYDVLKAWSVNNPALQHLIKKALAPGERGHKTLEQDMEDIVASAKRARELV